VTTQLDCSIGIKKESTYGTAVTVDQFVEFLTESLDRSPTFVQGTPLRVGSRVPRSGRRQLAAEGAGGAIGLEAQIRGLGIFLEAALGAVTSTAVPGATGAFQQVHTPSTTDPVASYTIQKGIPPLGGGATHAFTFPGCVCKGFELSAKADSTVELSFDWVGRQVRTDIAYAAPSYPANTDVLTFMHGALVVGGTVTAPTTTALATGGTVVGNVVDASLKWDNGLDEGGRGMGGAGMITRKPVLGTGGIEGTLTAEYTDTVLRDAYMNQTNLALLLTFTHPSALGTGTPVNPVLQVYVPVVRLDGEIPKANAGAPVRQSVKFTGLDGTVATSPIYVVYRTADTAV
jgi:hypothetical protein